MSGIRRDLRTNHQSRPISMNIGGVHEVDGASKYSQGKTSILATVIGPVVPKFQRHELTDKCKVEIEVKYAFNIEHIYATSAATSRFSNEEFAITKFLQRTIIPCIQLESFPRKLIVIQVVILQNEGSVVSAALNATILALLDSGIPLFYYMSCVELAVVKEGVYLDPSAEEETIANGVLTICIKGQQGADVVDEVESIQFEDKIIALDLTGSVSSHIIPFATDIACKYSQALSNSMRQTIATNLSNVILY